MCVCVCVCDTYLHIDAYHDILIVLLLHHQNTQKSPRHPLGQALLSADVGFEATAPEKLHATFVFHGQLLQALPKPQLVARRCGKIGSPQKMCQWIDYNIITSTIRRYNPKL